MKIISASEFRNHLNKYLDLVDKGEDLVIKSRKFGLFRVRPVPAK